MKVAPEKSLPAVAHLEGCGIAEFVKLAEGAPRGGPRGLSILLYTGAPVARYGTRIVFDLSGMQQPPGEQCPILFAHDPERPIGFSTEKPTLTPKLRVKGQMMARENFEAGSPARAAIGLVEGAADQGYAWQASMGVRMSEVRWLDEGEAREVNGADFKGPGYVVTKSQLLEASVLALGADGQTQSTVLSLSGESPADIVNVHFAQRSEIPMAVTDKTDRAELKSFLAAFPAERRAWAADRFAEGDSLVDAQAKLSAILLNEREASAKAFAGEREKLEGEVAELRKKLALVGREGFAAEAGVPPVRGEGSEAILEADLPELAAVHALMFVGSEGAELRVSLNEQLMPAWSKLPKEARVAFGAKIDNFRALKMAEAKFRPNGESLVKINHQPHEWEKLSGVARSGPDYSAVTVRGIIGVFYRRIEDVLGGSWQARVAMIVPSNQETETFKLLGMVPMVREWKGGRLLQALRTDGFTIRNKPFEASLPVSVDDWRRDKTGQIAIRMGDLSKRTAQHPEALISALLETNGLCYDGQNFFDIDHSLGSSGTQKNELAAADVPALNVAVATAPTADEMVDVLIGLISYAYGYKDDQGQPINGDAKQWIVMVTPNLMGATAAAISTILRKNGSSNEVKAQDYQISLIVNPRLTSTTKVYVFREDVEMKPIIVLDEVSPQLEFMGQGSDHAFKTRQYVFGVFKSGNAGYGEPLHALRGTLS